MHKKVLIKPNK